MNDHHFLPFNEGRVLISPIPAGSYLVRFYPDDGPHYDRMIVVTEGEDGTLVLAGWIGEPLTPAEWRMLGTVWFPNARAVEFGRLKAGGIVTHRLELEMRQ